MKYLRNPPSLASDRSEARGERDLLPVVLGALPLAPITHDMNGNTTAGAPLGTLVVDSSSCPLSLSSDVNNRCFHCGSTKPFYTDVAQGDLVCTVCGVVQAESMLDTSPEWRDYAEDTTNTNKARCGMVPTDESQWVGGLEPTRLSHVPFGGPTSDLSGLRQTLQRIQHRTDAFLTKTQKRSWEKAESAVEIAKRKERNKRQKQRDRGMLGDQHDAKPEYDTSTDTDLDEKRPSYDLVVVEEDEEDAQPELAEQVRQLAVQRQQLYAEKWSLQRALEPMDNVLAALKKTKKVSRKEEEVLKKASASLREAYNALREAAKSLPKSALDNAAIRLEQYATQRNGLPKDMSVLAAALLGRQMNVSKKLYQKAVKDLQKYKLFRAASIEEWIRPLELPTTAVAVVLHVLEKKGPKAMAKKAYAASLTYLVCAAGARAQQWAKATSTTTVAWDAWREELVWERSPSAIAKAFDVAESHVRQQYATSIFPERQALLQTAADTATPLKTVLLPQLLATAATLKMSDFDAEMKMSK